MTDETRDDGERGIDRRRVLRSAAAASVAGLVGVPAFSWGAVAQSSETLYLTDTGGNNASFDGSTKLYDVDLVTEDGTDKAELRLLEHITSNDFAQVDAIAATPDDETIHLIDKNSAHLGEYTVDTGDFTDRGAISGLSSGDQVVLATYSPDGTLYVAGQSGGDNLYAVDPGGPSATVVTSISGVNVQGADLAFDASGTLYLFSSADGRLYTLDTTTGEATEVGGAGSQSNKGAFTGLAVRDDGNGNLVGSATADDTIWVLDKATGSKRTGYRMYLDGSEHSYGYGDMTVGRLCTPCESGEELLVKYEWDDGFSVEGQADGGIQLGEVTLDADGEPTEACFTTDYCGVDAVVKAGTEYETYDDVSGEVCVTGIDGRAISNVRFFCEAPEDPSVGNSGTPGRGRGQGSGR